MHPELKQDFLAFLRAGLPRVTGQPLRTIIVGAGMAGLVAGYELARAGHEPVLLEARDRVGGRVETLRAPFRDGLHVEAGAMGIPAAHSLALEYVHRLGLSTVPFRVANPSAYYHIGGVRRRIAEARSDPGAAGLAVGPSGRNIGDAWEAALAPLRAQVAGGGAEAWRQLERQYDDCSLRQFLRQQAWSETAIALLGILLNQEADLHTSALEFLCEELARTYTDTVTPAGGMDGLPLGLARGLEGRIVLGARVVAVHQSADQVVVSYERRGETSQVFGDYAIITTPFPVLRYVDFAPALSPGKARAIRQLHYDAATKVFLQFGRRFWEQDDDISSGASLTDLPIRKVYYLPDGGRDGPGVILASLTWGNEARAWSAWSEEERQRQALRYLSCLHAQAAESVECGISRCWHADPFAMGAFALNLPGQHALLQADAARPEGRLYFAGEHTSLAHGWIEGAISSALRAVVLLAAPESALALTAARAWAE